MRAFLRPLVFSFVRRTWWPVAWPGVLPGSRSRSPCPGRPVLPLQLRALGEPQPRLQEIGQPQADVPPAKGGVPSNSEPQTPAPSSQAALDLKRRGEKGKRSLAGKAKPSSELCSHKRSGSSRPYSAHALGGKGRLLLAGRSSGRAPVVRAVGPFPSHWHCILVETSALLIGSRVKKARLHPYSGRGWDGGI